MLYKSKNEMSTFVFFMCQNCEAKSGKFLTEDEALDSWNKRYTKREELIDMREELRAYKPILVDLSVTLNILNEKMIGIWALCKRMAYDE